MNKNLTEIVYILDRSGSMSGLEKDTIGGYNSFLKKQKAEPGQAVVTTVLFDDKCETIHDRVDIRKVEPLTNRQYYARGMTALLDAVGETIKRVSNRHKNALPERSPGENHRCDHHRRLRKCQHGIYIPHGEGHGMPAKGKIRMGVFVFGR